MLLFLVPIQGYSDVPPSDEYKLKAALIYKLAKFIEWPNRGYGIPDKSFGICVLGDDPFGTALDVLNTHRIKGRQITIHRMAYSEEIKAGACRVLFISDSKQPFMKSMLQNLQYQPILTIGDTKGFAEKGGVIQLSSGERRTSFRINLTSGKRAGLEIAAPLLELATIVY